MKIKTIKEARRVMPFAVSQQDGADVEEILVTMKNKNSVLFQREIYNGNERLGACIYYEKHQAIVQIYEARASKIGDGWLGKVEEFTPEFIVTICDWQGNVKERDYVRLYVAGQRKACIINDLAMLDVFLPYTEARKAGMEGDKSLLDCMLEMIRKHSFGLFGGTECMTLGYVGLFVDSKRVSTPSQYQRLFPDTQWDDKQLEAILALFHTYALKIDSDEDNPIEDIYEADTLVDCCPVEIEESDDISDEALEAYQNDDYENEALLDFVRRELDGCEELAWQGSNGKWYCLPHEGYRMLSRSTL